MDKGAGAQPSKDATIELKTLSLMKAINDLLRYGEHLGALGARGVCVNWRDLEKKLPSLREHINDLLRLSQLLHTYVIDHWHDLMDVKKPDYHLATTAITDAKRHEEVLRRFADGYDVEAVWQKVFRLTVKRLMVKRPEDLPCTESVMLIPMRFFTFILVLLNSARSVDEQYREQSSYRSKLKVALKKSNKFAREAINTPLVSEKRLLLRRADEELDDYDWGTDRAWPEGMRAAQFFTRKYPDEKLPPPREDSNGSRVKKLFVINLSNFLEELTGEQLYEEVAYFTQIALDIIINKHEVRAILERPTDRAGRKARSRKEK